MKQPHPLFSSMVYVLDYLYKTAIALPQDLISELHLRSHRNNKDQHKKILGYWDFNQRLAKTGDFIVFLEVLNVLQLKFGLSQEHKNVDICFIDDATHYNSTFQPYHKSYVFKKTIKTLPLLHPHLDSVFLFNSNKEFERFYRQNQGRYIRWPPTISGSIPSDCRIIEKHFAKNGSIPLLSINQDIREIIGKFYEKEVYPAHPVVLNIRNHAEHTPERNSNLRELKKFLQAYEADQKYKFIVICSKEEMPAEFQGLSNVLFSKNYFEGIEYDLALIKTSYLSIFPDSGMATFAYFSGVPFIQHGLPCSKKLHRHMAPLNGKGFNFLSEQQRRFNTKETTPQLLQEFESLTAYLEQKELREEENIRLAPPTKSSKMH